MYPNPFYRNVPYRAPAIPPRIPPVPFRSPGYPSPGFFGGRAPGAGIPRAGFPRFGAPGFGFPGGRFSRAGFPGTGLPGAAADVAAGAASVAGVAEAAGAAEVAGAAAGAAGVSSLLAPARIEQFLQSTGQFMKTAQTYAPYVQQAVPMFKNIPALFRLYKGFQNAPDANRKSTSSKSSAKSDTFSKPDKQPKRSADYSTKPSLPKIYQPE
ncbi:MAG: VrrA/YqfQ family protein [Lysinibacillus sp.]